MPPIRSPRDRLLCLLVTCALLGAGCTGTYVRHTGSADLTDSWRASAITSGELSARSMQTLRRHDLAHLYPDRLEEAANYLHAEVLRDQQPDLLFTLAELHYLRGQKAEHCRCRDAVVWYYLAAGYAYHFLFDHNPPAASADIQLAGGTGTMDQGATQEEAFDPRFRLACDLYNAGLAKCIAAAQKAGQFDPRQRLVLPTGDGQHQITLAVVHHGFAYKPEEFGPVQLCSDYQVVGLANHYRTYGLGVPLVGSRASDAPRPPHAYYPARINFPVTAFFRFEGTLAELAERRAGHLELFNPQAIQHVRVGLRDVPLESDLTTPLACYLSETRLQEAGYFGFVRPGSIRRAVGLHSLEPYQPGKIPVVMVHGLLSSPITWAPMFNDLQADPVLRKRFQFWVYFYPTGMPFLATAAELRKDLSKMRQALDPEGKDAALDDMVLVGHSMGGLISRLMTVDGGEDFWKLVSPAQSLDQLALLPTTRAELRTTFFFARQRGVTRAIFLATPHHGSGLSPSVLGRVGARLAGLPSDLAAAVQDAAKENPQLAASIRNMALPTSVDELAPESPALQLVAHRERPQAVQYHSVIGVVSSLRLPLERLFGVGYRQPSDGVVPYSSAHLDNVASELVVPADHYEVHQHPLAILEVRRILLEHLRDYERRQPIQQVKGGS
jgi:pimeloyl-ACP methyl ester carboxylesterase